MPERPDPGRGLRAGPAIRVGPTTLLVIERVSVRSGCEDACAWLSASLEPHALVVSDGDGIRAMAIGAAPVFLEDLRTRAQWLDDALAATNP